MRRTVALILLCAVTVSAFAGCLGTQRAPDQTNATVTPAQYRVAVGSAIVDAEAADTPAKQETGLMDRADLGPNAGMLFLFSSSAQQAMWMKNMRFPIDIVFIADDLRVEHVYAAVPPCTTDPCPIYWSDGPIRYVLEVNAGFCAQHNITRGAPVTITPSPR